MIGRVAYWIDRPGPGRLEEEPVEVGSEELEKLPERPFHNEGEIPTSRLLLAGGALVGLLGLLGWLSNKSRWSQQPDSQPWQKNRPDMPGLFDAGAVAPAISER